MPARDEEDRERPPYARWEGEATHSADSGHPAGLQAPAGEVRSTTYGSGRWGGSADSASSSGYGSPSGTGYGQTAPGHSGYGQGSSSPGTGVSHAGAAGYSGYTGSGGSYAGARGPQAQTPGPPPWASAAEARTREDWFDQDYQQWREEQSRKLDDDYRSWRQARYRRFADEFDAWRSGRQDPGPTTAAAAAGRATQADTPTSTPGIPPSPSFPPK